MKAMARVMAVVLYRAASLAQAPKPPRYIQHVNGGWFFCRGVEMRGNGACRVRTGGCCVSAAAHV